MRDKDSDNPAPPVRHNGKGDDCEAPMGKAEGREVEVRNNSDKCKVPIGQAEGCAITMRNGES